MPRISVTLSSAVFRSAAASKLFNILLEGMCREIDFETTLESTVCLKKRLTFGLL